MFEIPFPTVFLLKGNKLGLEKSREMPKDSCGPVTFTVEFSDAEGKSERHLYESHLFDLSTFNILFKNVVVTPQKGTAWPLN